MLITAGVRTGAAKDNCDDVAIVGSILINNGFYECNEEEFRLIGLADGVGGNAGGNEASSFVAEHLSRLDFPSDAGAIKELMIRLNDSLIAYAGSTQNKKQMATTLTAIVFSEESKFLIHVGNTRMYVGQGMYLKQFTDDHTTYQWLLSHGQTEAAEMCNKSEISACMGANPRFLDRMIVKRVFDEGIPDCIVFSSDGIHEYVDIDRLEEMIFSGSEDKKIVEDIIHEAEYNGSKDDKTLIIVRNPKI